MVTAPQRILRAFGPLLDIDEVLQIEPGRYLTFEYIGPTDFFHEAPTDKVMTRGQVDGLLDASYRLRALRDGLDAAAQTAEVVIEIEKHSDGTLLVPPAYTS